MKTDGNDQAYPVPDIIDYGLTKRELFAAMALQGLLSNPKVIEHCVIEETLRTAIKYTDALINQLNQ